jgi:hypothetical protein
MANKIQLRRDTTVNWTTADPTLSQGEIGLDLTTGNIKIGTGLDSWSELDYAIPSIVGLASEVYVNNAITALKAGAGSALDTLNELATALGNDANFSATVTAQLGLKANKSELSLVANSGNYNDLLNKPVLFDGAYNSLTGKPTLFNGDYNNLSNKPTLFDGDYDSLTHKPTLFSGDYDDLTDKPTLFDGDYDSLTSKPTLFNGVYSSLTGRPTLSAVSATGEYNDLLNKPSLSTVATSGSYADLSNKPAMATVATSGAYADLSGRPTLSNVATSGSYDDLSNKPSLFSGSYADLSNKPTLAAVATSGSYADLTGNPDVDKITLGDGTATNPSLVFGTDGSVDTGLFHPADGVVCVSSNGQEKLRVDSGGARVNGFMKVANVNGNLPNPPEIGMIVFDGATFKGYNGAAWVNLS